MNDTPFQPPRPERVQIAGPAGVLEAILEVPDHAKGDVFGVVCHPHPQQGGTMNNKVVHTLARAFNELGVPTLRFNFRGVGASEGEFANSIGETDDAMAVIADGKRRWPGARLWMAGFSFGGVVAIRAAQKESAVLLVTVSPAVTRLEVTGPLPDCPWLLVQGDADDVVDPNAVKAWAAQASPAPEVHVMSGAGHFFHGRLTDLRNVVTAFATKK